MTRPGAGDPARPATSSPARKVGIGLIGIGWMGRLHSQAYRRVNYHYPELDVYPRLVVASDISSERRELAVRELGYERSTDEWEKVIADDAVEAVSITAPNYLHKEMALAVCSYGKHFWIEKPLGRNAQETKEIARAAEEASVRSAVGFNYRHAPALQWARDLLRSGRIGQVTHVRGIFLNDYAAEPRAALSWRFLRSLGGWGVIGDLASHTVDLLQYLVGPISEVSAATATLIAERPLLPVGQGTHFSIVEDGELAPVENEDYVGSLLRFADGAVGSLEASRITVGPRCQIAVDIYGSDGAISWDFERMGELRVCLGRSGAAHGYTTVLAGPGHGDYGHFQPGPAIAMSYDDLKVTEAALFLESIASGRQVGAGVADAWATARVLAAIEEAARSGRWEKVRDEEGLGGPKGGAG